jgi:cytochrome c
MRVWVIAVLTVAMVVGLGFVHPFGNPRAGSAEGLGTLLQDTKMPADARAVLVSKCADCHSNSTNWPIYSRIAPGSWLIERDIVEARKKMDLTGWETMPEDQQRVMAAKIVEEVRAGHMPPLQYRLLHWNANVSGADMEALLKLGRGPNGSEDTPVGTGDAIRGKAVFERRCTGCHALNADREGPRLSGVYGRKAGSVAGFDYSAGLKNLGITWTDATLQKWLTDPDLVVKDNKMSISVPKAQDRLDIIAFLKQR